MAGFKHLRQEVRIVRSGPTGIWHRQGPTISGLDGAENLSIAPPPIVNLLGGQPRPRGPDPGMTYKMRAHPAVTDYGKVETEAAEGEKIEPVLVSAGPIDKLRHAYPNFFLDIDDFANNVSGIISAVKQ